MENQLEWILKDEKRIFESKIESTDYLMGIVCAAVGMMPSLGRFQTEPKWKISD